MVNLTGVPSVWSDLNLSTRNQQNLEDEEVTARKKKILAAGQTSDNMSAAQTLFGSSLNSMGTPRA